MSYDFIIQFLGYFTFLLWFFSIIWKLVLPCPGDKLMDPDLTTKDCDYCWWFLLSFWLAKTYYRYLDLLIEHAKNGCQFAQDILKLSWGKCDDDYDDDDDDDENLGSYIYANDHRPGGRLNIKMLSYQYRDPHVKDKTVSPTVLSLTWESPYLGKTVFILRRGPVDSPP